MLCSYKQGCEYRCVVEGTTCDVSLSKRIDCGYKGILKETCMNKGCCWDEAARDTACCFYPATQKPDLNCDVGDPTKRYDCGYPDIPMDECLQRDCCWDNSIPNVKWCFHPVHSGPGTYRNFDTRFCSFLCLLKKQQYSL